MSDQSDLHAWQLEQVRSALELIAADPQEQMDRLERLGTAPSLDEIALEFEDAHALIPGLVRRGAVPRQLEQVLTEIEADIQEMTRHPDLWSRQAIDGPQWRSLRALGKQALGLVQTPRESSA